MDSNWRWLESEGTNCFTGNEWDNSTCPSTDAGAVSCATTCAVEGATYEKSYGITTEGNSLVIDFVTTTDNVKQLRKGFGSEETLTNVGSRNYLMNTEDKVFFHHNYHVGCITPLLLVLTIFFNVLCLFPSCFDCISTRCST